MKILTPIDDKCDSVMIGWVNFVMEAYTVRVARLAKTLSDDELSSIVSHKDKYSDAGNLN